MESFQAREKIQLPNTPLHFRRGTPCSILKMGLAVVHLLLVFTQCLLYSELCLEDVQVRVLFRQKLDVVA